MFFSTAEPTNLKSSCDSSTTDVDSVVLENPKREPEPKYDSVFLSTSSPSNLTIPEPICIGRTKILALPLISTFPEPI